MKLMPGKLTRRGLLLRSPYAIAVGAFAYGSLFERVHFTVERVTCPVPKPYQHLDGLRIAFMTDFHFDDFGNEKMLYRAVKTINSEAVDLVMLGGDYVSNDPTYLEPLGEILQNLRARLGIYGVMGNHEYHYDSTLAVKILSKKGVRFLINDIEEFEHFSLMGQDSAWEGAASLARNMQQAPMDKPIILGWHEPDSFDFHQDQRVVLQLSGHTHGGQVCAPFYGPLLLPHLGKKYVSGLFQEKGRNLYVSRGFGTLNIPARFLCPPEVTILTLSAS